MQRYARWAIVAALAVTGATALAEERPTGEAALAKMLEGRVAEKPVNCMSQAQLRSSETIKGVGIVYRGPGGRLYVNRPTGSLDQLDGDNILVSRTYGSQLCSNDSIQLVDRQTGMFAGFVILGEFTPYRRVRK